MRPFFFDTFMHNSDRHCTNQIVLNQPETVLFGCGIFRLR